MNEKKKNELRDQIWMTRMCRINAEKRYNYKSQFIEGLNIYYSLFCVIVSIALIYFPYQSVSFLILTMTIITLVSTLFFKGLRFPEQADEYRKIYTELQRLEMKMGHADITMKEIEEIENQYCNILKEGKNHSSFDYTSAVYHSNSKYKEEHHISQLNINRKYYWGQIWRMIVVIICVVIPLLITFLACLGEKDGWFASI